MEFNSLEDLYKRLTPALESKLTELKRDGFDYLTKEDIWNYLKEKKWATSHNLSLNEMVDDIFYTDNILIDEYFKKNLKQTRSEKYAEKNMA